MSGAGWNMGGNTWMLSMVMGTGAEAVGGEWPVPPVGQPMFAGGGETKEECEEDIIIELSDWQDNVGEFGDGGGTLNC